MGGIKNPVVVVSVLTANGDDHFGMGLPVGLDNIRYAVFIKVAVMTIEEVMP